METTFGRSVDKAAQNLKAGRLVAIPTETVYGLGGNALDEQAVTQIFEAKQRPKFDPLILHLDSIEKAEPFVEEIPPVIKKLAHQFSPGPITYILPKKPVIPDLVTSGQSTVAIRIPNHSLTLELLKKLDFPVAAPSANPFSYVSPTTAQHVYDQLHNKITYILDGGPCQVGLESTIVKAESRGIRVLRLGGTPVEALKEYVKKVEVERTSGSDPESPGQLKSHYSPGTPVKFGKPEKWLKKFKPHQIGMITFHHLYQAIPEANQYMLSPKKDLSEAARNLFRALRYWDSRNFKVIIAEPFPEEGLGMAINDRLKRAAEKA